MLYVFYVFNIPMCLLACKDTPHPDPLFLTNDKKSAMRPYPAQAHGRDAEVGSDQLERYPLEDVGGSVQQIAVAFLGAVELQAFHAVDRVHITRLEDFSEQAFDVRESIVQTEKMGGTDRHDFRNLQHLDAFPGGPSGEKAFHPRNDLVFKGEALRDIDLAFKIVNARQTFVDKINRPTSVPDGLQIPAFPDGVGRANRLNGRFRPIG